MKQAVKNSLSDTMDGVASKASEIARRLAKPKMRALLQEKRQVRPTPLLIVITLRLDWIGLDWIAVCVIVELMPMVCLCVFDRNYRVPCKKLHSFVWSIRCMSLSLSLSLSLSVMS
jgi:hypothetical protein